MVFNVNVGFADLTMQKDGKGKPCALFLGDTVTVNEVCSFDHGHSGPLWGAGSVISGAKHWLERRQSLDHFLK